MKQAIHKDNLEDKELVHIPVMLEDVIKHWVNVKDGIYVDCTFGAGNHTKTLLKQLNDNAQVFGVDVDVNSQKFGFELEKNDLRFKFLNLNFADLFKYWKSRNLPKVNGILFDLGLSTIQLKDNDRGFSYNTDGALDMRIDERTHKSASFILNTYSKKDLFDLFKKYGEIKNPRKIVDIIGEYRKNYEIETVEDFKRIIELAFPVDKYKFNKSPFKMFFQALRVEANNEIENLNAALEYLNNILHPNGYALFITFHSQEEKIIKKWIEKNCKNILIPDFGHNLTNKFKLINNGYITPSKSEIFSNWSSRSAKLWVFQKIENQTIF